MEKQYLGDGAFIEPGEYVGEIVLSTEDGIRTTNQIVLGTNEVESLLDFIRRYERYHDISFRWPK